MKEKLEKLTIFVENNLRGNNLGSVNASNPALEDLIAAAIGDIGVVPKVNTSENFNKHLDRGWNCDQRINEMEDATLTYYNHIKWI